jgi:sugar phosphate isomerase/epimerase
MDHPLIGVCGWSIDRNNVLAGIDYAAGTLGVSLVQIGFFSEKALHEADASRITSAAAAAGVGVVAPFLAFEGEDYSSIAAVAASGGLMGDATLDHRLALLDEIAELAVGLRMPAVVIHAGTVPPAADAAMYGKFRDRVRDAADRVGRRGLRLWLEAGRESADALCGLIDATGADNLGVNYDAGNFVVYGSDDPSKAVSRLRGRIDNVHLKDAMASADPGRAFGSPALLGSGDAQIARVVNKLRTTGYTGPLLIEADTRKFGLESLGSAVEYLNTLIQNNY